MKKTYQVKKQAKLHRARKIIIHVGVQFFIVAMMLGFIYQSRSASGENTNRITVTVNDAYYDYGPQRRSPKFFIHTSTGTYRFNSGATIEHGYHIRELQDRIQIGDVLEITYMETYLLTGKKNVVVEATKGTAVLYTISDYNNSYKGSNVYISLLFVLLEAGIWFVISLQEGWFFTWVGKGRIKHKETPAKRPPKTGDGSLS